MLTFLIQTFLAKVYVIPSGSMETTLHGCTGCVNDRVLVDKITYRFRDPQPGDVVVFRGPDSWRSEFTVDEPASPLVRGLQGLGSLIGLAPPDEKDFVKRVIAVGGQTIACCDPRNRVLVDNKPLERALHLLPARGGAGAAGAVRARHGAHDELWMMGDSRNNSADSRVPGHGAVPLENVIGQARLIVMPFDRFGTIAAVDPQTDAVGMAERHGGSIGGPSAAAGRARRRAAAAASATGAVPGVRARPRCAGAGGAPDTLVAMTARSARRSPLPPEWRPSRAVVRRSSGTWTLQSTLHRHGLGPVAGVDEAGRGACAGPLVVAACVLRPGDARRLDGLTDSKLLTPAARDEYYDLIVRRCADSAVVVIPPAEIDRRGVHVANIEGMRRAVAALATPPGTSSPTVSPSAGSAVLRSPCRRATRPRPASRRRPCSRR